MVLEPAVQVNWGRGKNWVLDMLWPLDTLSTTSKCFSFNLQITTIEQVTLLTTI